jgi:hypothetical protein
MLKMAQGYRMIGFKSWLIGPEHLGVDHATASGLCSPSFGGDFTETLTCSTTWQGFRLLSAPYNHAINQFDTAGRFIIVSLRATQFSVVALFSRPDLERTS